VFASLRALLSLILMRQSADVNVMAKHSNNTRKEEKITNMT